MDVAEKEIMGMDKLSEILKGLKFIFKNRIYLSIFIFLFMSVFILMFFLPVGMIPGNSVKIQSSIFLQKDYWLFGILSFLSSLIVVMQVAIVRENNALKIKNSAAIGSFGIFSGVVSSVFGTATCGLCVSALFGFLGAGTIIFLVDHRLYVVFGSIALLLFSLYFSAKRVNQNCAECKIIKIM